MPTVLLTGANRGLGLEFARRYAELGWLVHACCRQPDRADQLQAVAAAHSDRIRVHRLDVLDHGRIADLAAELAGTPIDLLLNNAGVYGPQKMLLGRLDYDSWAEVFAVNVLGPMRLAECLLEHVAASQRKVIACVSSFMGSLTGNTDGRHYLYRSSKAALNAVVRSLAIDLRERGVTVVTLHPGWVKTDMGGGDADLEIAQSVADVIALLERVGPAESGRFFNHNGAELPW